MMPADYDQLRWQLQAHTLLGQLLGLSTLARALHGVHGRSTLASFPAITWAVGSAGSVLIGTCDGGAAARAEWDSWDAELRKQFGMPATDRAYADSEGCLRLTACWQTPPGVQLVLRADILPDEEAGP